MVLDVNDPEMRDILLEFCDESDTLLEDLRDILDRFEEETSQAHLLEKFGQTIDRIMGAAKTLGAEEIGALCHMGKIIGYKASQVKASPLQELTAGVLFDLCDFLEVLLVNIREKKTQSDLNYETFQKRLQWLADKFKDIDRASCAIDEKSPSPHESAPQELKETTELQGLISQLGKSAS